MPLSAGTKLGPYELVAPLGAGGMGEVYRARDSRLDRTVAIKVLPSHLTGDPEARQRFDREARAISSLNHPHICTLHDVGHQDGIDFLVMEFLEGETLADRLARGALPLDQLLKLGMEICEGLEKAHRSGVIHRDLKPGNIMLTKTGAKLMDFGLARALPANAPPVSSLTAAATSPVGSRPLTAQGTVVGTFQYMSPEQLEGKEADARSDVFALGAVLYEMATGKRAFEGKSTASVIAAILAYEPPAISAAQPMSPPALDRVVKTCLAKDPDERFQNVHDVKLQLKWIGEGGSQMAGHVTQLTSAATAQTAWRRNLPWGIAVGLALALALLSVRLWQHTSPPAPLERLSVAIGADASVATEWGSAALLTPDGTRLILTANVSSQPKMLYVRLLDQFAATPLAGTQGARDAFVSPHGQWIAFFADGKLKKISIQGGAVVTLCDANNDRGGSWGDDGNIIFASGNRSVLFKISSEGGKPEPLTTFDSGASEVTHRFPQVLPGSKDILFTSHTSGTDFDDATIVAQSLETGKRKVILRGGMYARYLPSGHLVYAHLGTLFAEPFDPRRLEITGKTVPVLEGVSTGSIHGTAQFDFSASGAFIYVAGNVILGNSLFLLDRGARAQPLKSAPGNYYRPRWSPDGKHLALVVTSPEGNADIWLYEPQRDALQRFTLSGSFNLDPEWTPDGRYIAFSSNRGEEKNQNIYWQRSDGSGEAERLTSDKGQQHPSSWRPDGRVLAFTQSPPEGGLRIWTLPMEGDRNSVLKPGKPILFSSGSWNEWGPAFSPDGRWLAYASGESGRAEVFVRPYPGPGGKRQVSTEGGNWPRWSAKGAEIFFETPDSKIWSARYTAVGESFSVEKPQLWSGVVLADVGLGWNYDVAPDGKRLVILGSPEGTKSPNVDHVNFILNFFDELRRIAPAKP